MGRYNTELAFAVETSVEAGREVRRQYDSASTKTYIKPDDSPVTDADLASDQIIRERVAAVFPADSILTEEGIDDPARLTAKRVWIADPIDGTQQFVNRTGQFDVLLALVINGRPVVAVMLQPTTMIYLAAEINHGAIIGDAETGREEELRLASPGSDTNMTTTVWLGAPESAIHLNRVAGRLGLESPCTTETGVIARGHVDPDLAILAGRNDRGQILAYSNPAHAFVGLPMRGDGTMAWEWDFAASDLIINEAGGRFTDWFGDPFQYNKLRPRNEGGLVIANTPELHTKLIAAIAPEIELVNHSRREK